MTDKEAVINALATVPENASLEEIMAGGRRGRAAIAAGRIKTHEEVKRLVETWAKSGPIHNPKQS